MRMKVHFSTVSSGGVAPALIKGYKFFDSKTGENILIKGIDYYPRPNVGPFDGNNIDFFTEEFRDSWERDIQQFKELGINAVRLYSVDPEKDHSAFMCALGKAGIYAVVGLGTGKCPLCAVKAEFATPACYPKELKTRGETIILEFSRYDNTLAFSAGNEVNHYVPLGARPEFSAPCQKKFMRDMRAFIKSCENMRQVPVGLAMADTDRDQNTMYYNCQSDPNDDLEHAEWYGINTYVFCDGNAKTYDDALGFKALVRSFEGYHYSIPVLLTEYGCLSETFATIDGYSAQRNFKQAQWLGRPDLQDLFAGGFVFEYSIESSIARTPFPFKEFGHQNFGIGYFSPKLCDDLSIPCNYNRTPSFYNLQYAYDSFTPNPNITLSSFNPLEDRLGRTECPIEFPDFRSFEWEADSVTSLSCPLESEATCSCESKSERKTESQSQGQSKSFYIVFLPLLVLTMLCFLRRKKRIMSISRDIENCSVLKDTVVREGEAEQTSSEDESQSLLSEGQENASYMSVNS